MKKFLTEFEKFDFSQRDVYKYLYRLNVNSTFDKEIVTTSELKLEFLIELRIEDCEGVMRVGNVYFFFMVKKQYIERTIISILYKNLNNLDTV